MSQIFISYKSEDREHTAKLAAALESKGHDVWWDHALTAGRTYREEIAAALKDCDVAIVIWTPRSIKSSWVKDEADVGARKEKLLPVMIRRGSMGNTVNFDIPLGFGQIQTEDLTDWDGDANAEVIQKLNRGIETLGTGDIAWDDLTYVANAAGESVSKFWGSFTNVTKTTEIGGLPIQSLFLGTLALTLAGVFSYCAGITLLGFEDDVTGAIFRSPLVFGLVALLRIAFQFVYITSGRSSRQFFDSAFTWVFLFSILAATLTVSVANLRAESPNALFLLILVPVLTLVFMFAFALVRVCAISMRLLFARL